MNLSDLASIATIVQGVFVIVSIGFVLYQLRENTRLTRAANTEKLVELTSPFHLQFIQNREMAELWVHGAINLGTMDPVDYYRYYALMSWWLTLHENVYHQKKKKLLDEDTYITWTHDLKYFIESQHLERIWVGMRDFYEPSFVKYIDELVGPSR